MGSNLSGIKHDERQPEAVHLIHRNNPSNGAIYSSSLYHCYDRNCSLRYINRNSHIEEDREVEFIPNLRPKITTLVIIYPVSSCWMSFDPRGSADTRMLSCNFGLCNCCK